ncbi:MAG TPA: glycosyltransferase family 39 protein [Gemmatimonadaceae bacterium]|nr:glycosyltransferase family 39 protein [Gemmatimonadaceae bacterium]
MIDAASPHTAVRTHARRTAVAVLLGGLLVRLLFAALLPLFPDEAYYWEWSRRLAWGYFDHPPAIALLVRVGTALFGSSAIGVRIFPVLAGFVASLAGVEIARRVGGDRAALLAAIVVTCFPLAAAGLVLATPDAPLLATTAVALYAVVRAIQAPVRSHASLGWWTVAGLLLGMAFSSKYTSILLPSGVLLALLARRDLRIRLTEPGPYVACIVATLVFLPVLLWNARHGWVSFGFQIQHGLGTARPDPLAPLKRLGDMLGGQAALASPILLVLLVVAVLRAIRARAPGDVFVLGVVAGFTFLFFCVSATRKRVEANWPAPAYIPGIALLAAYEWSGRGRRWLRAGVWLAALMSVVIYLHAAFGILPILPDQDPIARSAGYATLAARASSTQQAVQSQTGARTWLGADRYQDAAELAYHAPGQPVTFATNLAGRPNQYDLWTGFRNVAHRGENLVLALDDAAPSPVADALAPYFMAVRPGELVELRSRHGVVTRRRLWIFRGWRGGWPP